MVEKAQLALSSGIPCNLKHPMSKIKLIVGLGNPGAEYAATRHNAGFWFVDELARQSGASLRHDSKFHGLVAKARLDGNEVWLLQPQTFMNRSGLSVVSLAQFYRILPDEILVVHDELDLPPGQIKLKQGGGNGGHNGLKDMQARLGTPNFYRLRLGIDHPGDKNLVVGYVLNKPSAQERQQIDEAISKSLQSMPIIMAGEFEEAMRALHSK